MVRHARGGATRSLHPSGQWPDARPATHCAAAALMVDAGTLSLLLYGRGSARPDASARSRHTSVRSLERVRPTGASRPLSRYVAEHDPARRRR